MFVVRKAVSEKLYDLGLDGSYLDSSYQESSSPEGGWS